MTIEQSVVQRLRVLPKDKQREVLEFVEFLAHKQVVPASSRRRLKGSWADLKIDLSESDIKQARKEMWKNFPRDIEL
ncbi:MAG: DUF2281 domain-containing protein [Chloroflexi bacterium]|nr:DUF2281 domain-containing protein [Chloroflexota bacterium]